MMLSFFRNPEMAKAILNLPIEFEFSSAAGGANVGSQTGSQQANAERGNVICARSLNQEARSNRGF
jgi:hypothetical protein